MKSRTNSEHSALIKVGLRKARAAGRVGGNPNAAQVWPQAIETLKTNANTHAQTLAPVIQELQQEGYATLQAMANELNAREIKTARGGIWYPTTVKNLLERLNSN